MRAGVARPRALGLLVGAALTFVLFLALGIASAHGPPSGIDAWVAAALFGAATPLAAAITGAGTFPYYAGLALVVLGFGFLRRRWLSRALLAVGVLLTAWETSDAFKAAFHRARPPHMLVFHESSASYPSGHAVLATAFWGTLVAYVALASPGSHGWRKPALASAAVAWVLAIGWSRLALGAHFLSDVVGGYALGLTFALLAAAVATRLPAP